MDVGKWFFCFFVIVLFRISGILYVRMWIFWLVFRGVRIGFIVYFGRIDLEKRFFRF